MHNRQIVDYDLLSSDSLDKLTELVCKAMGNLDPGCWQPLGGVAIALSESDDYEYSLFVQAMVMWGATEENA